MRGLHVENGTVAYRTDLPPLNPPSGESRVRIILAGVCATDLALARGYMNFTGVPGHEFVGVATDGPLQGQRVVGEINAACGNCSWCRRDLGRHCPHRTVLGILGRPGCFAEEISLPDENLRAVPDAVSDAAAVFTEPLAAAFEIAEQIPLSRHENALVVGDGRLGLLCAHVLAAHGLEVTVAGRHPERGSLLGPGIAHRTGLVEERPAAGSRFDLVVEATGNPQILESALPWVRPRGTLILKTTSEKPATLDLAPIVIDEISVVGSRCGRFEPALEALARDPDAIPLEEFVHARYPLERGTEALEHAARPGVLKVLIELGSSR